ncbi:MAG: thymidine kinase [Pseudomonadota bacterium]
MAKLYFYYSSMNAGKSTTLLQADFNYRERGMRTMVWTAQLDDRDDAGWINSRIGLKKKANLFDDQTDMLAAIGELHEQAPLDCVLIDEAQFLTKDQVFQLALVCDQLKIPVLAYGLRTDFQAALFPGSAQLLAIADELVELKAVCECGRKSTMNMRVDEKGNPVLAGQQTEIGGNELYVALCRKHFMERLNG